MRKQYITELKQELVQKNSSYSITHDVVMLLEWLQMQLELLQWLGLHSPLGEHSRPGWFLESRRNWRAPWKNRIRSTKYHFYESEKITRKANDAAENLQLYWVIRFFHPRSTCTRHISADIFWRMQITRKASDAAENLQLYWVVRFFHPCTMHISADVQRITLNASLCITISGGRNEQLDCRFSAASLALRVIFSVS